MSLHPDGPKKPRLPDGEDRPGPPPLMSEERGRGRNRLAVIAAILAVTAFSGTVWYAYDHGRRIGSETAAPLIRAETAPAKLRPESPGGLKVPHQDKLVLDDLGSGRGTRNDGSRVERLLPPPEPPVPAPEPLPGIADLGRSTQSVPGAAPGAVPQATAQVLPAPSASLPEAPEIPPAAPALAASETTASETSGTGATATATEPPAASTSVQSPPADTVTAGEQAGIPAAAEPAAVPPVPAPAPAPRQLVRRQPAPPASPAPATSAPAAPAPSALATGDFNIQIAALRSEDAARREWSRVQSRNRQLLGALSPRFQRVSTGNGVFHRVQAGPLSRAAARQLCESLKAGGQACLVVRR